METNNFCILVWQMNVVIFWVGSFNGLFYYIRRVLNVVCLKEWMEYDFEGGFDSFDFEKEVEEEENSVKKPEIPKVGQEQIHRLLFGDQLSWQAIIYDLINTEQLDPWDIDLVVLSVKFLEKVRELEEANFFVSSKVLFATSLLLRIKTEIVLNQYLPNLDDILFGRKEEKKYVQERLELDEDVPELVPKSPLPRFRKVTLQELMSALGKAITTENRRIRKIITTRQQEIETAIALPRGQINIKEKIREVYSRLRNIFASNRNKIAFSSLTEKNGGDKIGTFVPLLHLDYQHKVFLEQENHFDEIWIWMKQFYDEKNKEELERLKKEVELAFAEDAVGEAAEEVFEREEKMEDEEDEFLESSGEFGPRREKAEE